MMLRRTIVSAIFMLAPALGAEPLKVKFCDLIASPATYTGKLIETKAMVRSGIGEQGIWMIDPKCGGTFSDAGVPFLRAAVITASPVTAEGRQVVIHERSLSELQGALAAPQRISGGVAATLTGVFESRSPIDRLGFGHLGGFPFQLVFQSAKNLKRIKAAKPSASHGSR